jgi:hypothetical protein
LVSAGIGGDLIGVSRVESAVFWLGAVAVTGAMLGVLVCGRAELRRERAVPAPHLE